MADDGSLVGKAVEKISGGLEKLVDAKMLVLGISLLLYLDIWLISANMNVGAMSLEESFSGTKHILVRTVIVFLVTYSMFMTIFFPAVRYLYNWVNLYFGGARTSNELRSIDERRLSVWATAVLSFFIWDWCCGFFKPITSYRGLVVYVWDSVSGEGATVVVFRIVTVFFLWFCILMAFERDY